jgi:ADP-ribose pyrophosphatase
MAASRLFGNIARRSKASPGNCRQAWSSAEDPAQACARELQEETGYPARFVHSLGAPLAACSGRLSNRIHSFFVETSDRAADFTPELGITVALKTPAELAAMITANEFVQQLHLGALMLAELRGFMTLPR